MCRGHGRQRQGVDHVAQAGVELVVDGAAVGREDRVGVDDRADLGIAEQRFQTSVAGGAVPARPGDRLVLRFVVERADGDNPYQPNATGAAASGRVPSITLPPPKQSSPGPSPRMKRATA